MDIGDLCAIVGVLASRGEAIKAGRSPGPLDALAFALGSADADDHDTLVSLASLAYLAGDGAAGDLISGLAALVKHRPRPPQMRWTYRPPRPVTRPGRNKTAPGQWELIQVT